MFKESMSRVKILFFLFFFFVVKYIFFIFHETLFIN